MRLCKEFGRKVATADEARKIMKIGVWYNSVEETLNNLGLPPNRNGRTTRASCFGRPTGNLTKGVVGSDSHPIASCLVPPPSVHAAE